MSEPVSDERLAELILFANHSGAPGSCYHIEREELVALAAELQSRRAAEQAALPAVEEMARKIAGRCWEAIGKSTDGVLLKPIIIAALAPLFAKLARQADLLAECRDFSIHDTPHVGENKCLGCRLANRIDAELAKGGE